MTPQRGQNPQAENRWSTENHFYTPAFCDYWDQVGKCLTGLSPPQPGIWAWVPVSQTSVPSFCRTVSQNMRFKPSSIQAKFLNSELGSPSLRWQHVRSEGHIVDCVRKGQCLLEEFKHQSTHLKLSPSTHCTASGKLAQTLWKSACRFLTKLKAELPTGPLRQLAHPVCCSLIHRSQLQIHLHVHQQGNG